MYPPLPSPEDLAAEWIAWQRTGGAPAGPENSAQYLLTEFPEDAPYLTWETILVVMQAYPEDAYYSTEPTEAQQVCGILAAGPVEDLLSFHGPHFIAAFEVQARLDRRMAWLLGGTWQHYMTDDVWKRVRAAADDSYWNRPTAD